MQKGQRIKLNTINGTNIPDLDTKESENYWKLINEKGTLLFFAKEKGFPDKNRVLIKFDTDVKSIGLACHNEEPNSLWVLISDITEI